TPIVDIRVCKEKGFTVNGKVYTKSIKSAVAEVAKYAVKASDYLAGTDKQNEEVVKTLLSVLRNRKMFAFTGIMRSVRQELKLDEIETGDLIHVEADEKPTSAALVAKLVFAWDNKIGEYVHTGVKIVDDEEQRASRTA
ncbi:MAG: protein rep, partial [Clostridia bacterium]|nr:protein rep [Clostridia bacterium]